MRKQPIIEGTNDVVDFLKQQHQEIKGLFASVLAARGLERQDAFFELRRLMAIHETAEEEVVHPAARRARGIGENVVADRLREEHEAKTALSALEQMDVASSEFEIKLRTLQAAVFAHAAAEESEEFANLSDELDEDRLRQMRKAVQFAESIAPTRSYPGIESAVANRLIGPFVALVDRARDALGRRESDVRSSQR
jgi:hemerythrin superfamily protein